MKFTYFLLLLLDAPHSKGQQTVETYGQILLKLSFPAVYNGLDKSCCKLYHRACYPLMDTKGFTCDRLRGRVTKTQNNGWIEFKIWNAQLVDAGYYRCLVVGTQIHQIYQDFYVEISEHSARRNLPLPSPTSTLKPLKTFRSPPETTGSILAEDHSGGPVIPWISDVHLAAIVSIAIAFIVVLVTTVVCCRLKAKKRRVQTLSDSSKHQAPEVSSTVYTTVDFIPRHTPSQLYVNLWTFSPTARGPDTDWSDGRDWTVEYSTLAVSQGI